MRAWFEQVVLPAREVWVAEECEEIVALLVLEADWIDQLYIEPDHTARGFGARLLEVAKQRRPAGLKLWTFEANVGARRSTRAMASLRQKPRMATTRRGPRTSVTSGGPTTGLSRNAGWMAV